MLSCFDSIIPESKRNTYILDGGASIESSKQELRRLQIQKALEETRGAWSAENYPHLKTREDVDRYIRHLRAQWMPRSWDEIVAGSAASTTGSES